MTRNLKLLGVALMATLALGATTASSAAAYQPSFTLTGLFLSAKLTGTIIENPNPHQFTFGEHVVNCKKAKIEGKFPGQVSTEVTLAQVYESCTGAVTGIGTNLPVTVTTNGCTFKYVSFPGGVEEEEYDGKLHLECPAGKQTEVHIFENVAEHNANKPACTYDIAPQTLEENVKIINDTGPKDVTLNTSSPFEAKATGPKAATCGGNKVNSIYHSTTTVTAKSTALEEPIGFHIG